MASAGPRRDLLPHPRRRVEPPGPMSVRGNDLQRRSLHEVRPGFPGPTQREGATVSVASQFLCKVAPEWCAFRCTGVACGPVPVSDPGELPLRSELSTVPARGFREAAAPCGVTRSHASRDGRARATCPAEKLGGSAKTARPVLASRKVRPSIERLQRVLFPSGARPPTPSTFVPQPRVGVSLHGSDMRPTGAWVGVPQRPFRNRFSLIGQKAAGGRQRWKRVSANTSAYAKRV